MIINNKDIKLFITLINDYQWDGCRYKIDGVYLTTLKKKLEDHMKKSKKMSGLKKVKGIK